MKKIHLSIIILLSIFLLIQCSLDRNNLLDPSGNSNTNYPPTIDSLWVNQSDYNLTWLKPIAVTPDSIQIIPDGYFIYGSRKYDTKYDRIHISQSPNDTLFNVENLFNTQGYRWFKVSSYIFYEEYGDTLEGFRSSPKTFSN